MKALLKAIEARQEQEEYLDRLHIALQATAFVKAINAALAEEECTVENLIGKQPGEAPEPKQASKDTQADKEMIEEWKKAAVDKGLKIH